MNKIFLFFIFLSLTLVNPKLNEATNTEFIPIAMNTVIEASIEKETATEVCYTITELDQSKTIIMNIIKISNKFQFEPVSNQNSEIIFNSYSSIKISGSDLPSSQFCLKLVNNEPSFSTSFQLFYLDTMDQHETEMPLYDNSLIYKRYLLQGKMHHLTLRKTKRQMGEMSISE